MRRDSSPIETLEPVYVSPHESATARTPAHVVAILLGAGFLAITAIGVVSPGFLGAHLSMTHNLIHLLSGCASLYFGLFGTVSGARLFCILFAIVYGGLAVAGFAMGGAGEHTVADVSHGHDSLLLRVVPGKFEVALSDHLIHTVIASVYLVAGILTRPRRRP
ncbi:MAG TPA: hypothetical protein VEL28_12575 [Candidatus Binatia bacterium]|nr:hypothetical protein [Candidatus Binatia bacterium]